jgi:hypothetical protein
MKERNRLTGILLALACLMFVLCVLAVVYFDAPFAGVAFALFGVALLPADRR